jgi:hypothetical protein
MFDIRAISPSQGLLQVVAVSNVVNTLFYPNTNEVKNQVRAGAPCAFGADDTTHSIIVVVMLGGLVCLGFCALLPRSKGLLPSQPPDQNT